MEWQRVAELGTPRPRRRLPQIGQPSLSYQLCNHTLFSLFDLTFTSRSPFCHSLPALLPHNHFLPKLYGFILPPYEDSQTPSSLPLLMIE